MDTERIIAERDELRAVVEAVNQVMRDEGYGQGELDDDLPGVIRGHLDRMNRVQEMQNWKGHR